MEFVLMDNSLITAHTERVSRLSQGVQNLKEKMSRMFGHQQVDHNVNEQVGAMAQNEPSYSEPMYNEPVQSAPVYNEPVQSAPVYNEPVQSAPVYNEPVQSAPVQRAPVQSAPVYNEPMQSAPVQNEPMTNQGNVNMNEYTESSMGNTTQAFDSDMSDSGSFDLDDDLDLDLDKMIADMRLDDAELGL